MRQLRRARERCHLRQRARGARDVAVRGHHRRVHALSRRPRGRRKKLTAWLERTQLPFPPGESPAPIALQVWNACRGIDWHALPILAEIHGVTDVELLIVELMTIRGFQEDKNG